MGDRCGNIAKSIRNLNKKAAESHKEASGHIDQVRAALEALSTALTSQGEGWAVLGEESMAQVKELSDQLAQEGLVVVPQVASEHRKCHEVIVLDPVNSNTVFAPITSPIWIQPGHLGKCAHEEGAIQASRSSAAMAHFA